MIQENKMADSRDSSCSNPVFSISDDLAETQDAFAVHLSQDHGHELSDSGKGGIVPTTFDPPMLFRRRHRLLHEIYNSQPDPEQLSAKNLDNISRQVGLCMEEVLLWLEDEKSRRVNVFNDYQPNHTSHESLLSPHSMVSPGTNSTTTLMMTPSDSTSTTDFLQLQGILSVFSPSPTTTGHSTPLPARRGRTPKTQSTTRSESPESKRQKLSYEYPCPDCGRSFAAERWSEHVKRVHFPSEVWECPKPNERTGKPCATASSKPFFRPDNFATHLRAEHNCDASEINQLKVTCKFALVGFFHQICGICGDALKSRDVSIEHIKEHFRDISLGPYPPTDLGASEWKERCGSNHVLKRGFHYQLNNLSGWKGKRVERNDIECFDISGSYRDHPENPVNQSEDHLKQYEDIPEEPLTVSKDSDLNGQLQPMETYVVTPHVINFPPYSAPLQSHTPFHALKWNENYKNGVDGWQWQHTSSNPIESSIIDCSTSTISGDSTGDSTEPQISEQSYPSATTPSCPFSGSKQYPPPYRPALASHASHSQQNGTFTYASEIEKGRCPYSSCGKIFKDLKSHLLTHSNERPEKCPMTTCDYNIKGFARKYDKNRHVLTHYKGKMVCGFCPGSGTMAEKSFNRADVFKRHLTSVHGVDQMLSFARKRMSDGLTEKPDVGAEKISGYASDAAGKCSTCSVAFITAQSFYEHLDDCVLRVVVQEGRCEAINTGPLREVE